MAATLKQAIDYIAAETNWPRKDLGHRVRWCQEAGLIEKGKAGRSGVGAHRVTVDDLITILLSTACPNGKEAAKWVPVFADLKARSGGKKVTLRDALRETINIYSGGDAQWKNAALREMGSPSLFDRIIFIFDEDWPRADLDFEYTEEDQEEFYSRMVLRFAPDADPPKNFRNWFNRATAISGGIVNIFADLLKDEEEPKTE